MIAPDTSATSAGTLFTLHVPDLEPRLRHTTIFRYFDELAPGAAFRIRNDHDPKPLYYQLIAERGNVFAWTYLEQGPKTWLVEIRKVDADNGPTVGEIAAKDLRKADVFRKYGIDFCCGGRKSLQQACAEKGLELAVVEAELNASTRGGAPSQSFDRWEPAFLADYIYNQHHRYFYDEAPVIDDLLEKVAGKHGAQFPELSGLRRAWKILASELTTHFAREEKVLFPFIKTLAAAQAGDDAAWQRSFSLREPVQMMEADHESAAELLATIRTLTDGYRKPAGACNSFGLLYVKLEDLERDLQQHIHLENNLLFPKALQLERTLRTGA